MSSVGDLVANLSLNTSGFSKSLQQSRTSLLSFAAVSGAVGGAVGSLASMAISGISGLGSSIVSMGKESLGLAAAAEQNQIAFEVMLGSAEQAKTLLQDLQEYSDRSPFDTAGVQEGAKRLLNYGIAAGDILPTMEMLGDVAAGDMQKFDGLATAFGQMSATGRLMGGDLNQFINAGFNPLQEIAAKTGESMGDLKKRMEEGGVSADEVKQAFQAATSEGGRFFGMTAKQSQTIAGKFSTMQDGVSNALRKLGQELTTRLNLSGWIDWISGWLDKIPDMITTVMDALTPIVQGGVDMAISAFNMLYEGTDAALVALGQSIGINLDMTTAIEGVREAVEGIPFFFRNAGALIETAIIDWNLALFELVPGTENIMGQVGAFFVATFDGITASAGAFVQNVIDGFREIGNIAVAVWEGIKKGFTTGSITEAISSAVETLANQEQSTGEHFATVFADTFNKTMADAAEGFADQGGYASTLRKRKEQLAQDIVAAELAVQEEASKKVGEEVARVELPKGKATTGDGASSKSGKDKLNKVSFLGSSEAAETIARAMNVKSANTKSEQLLTKQTVIAEKSLAVLETIAESPDDAPARDLT